MLMATAVVLGLASCVSLNSHQTGRTVGKGNHSSLVNFNFGYINSSQYSAIEDSGAFYIAEIGAFHGIGENLDIGLRVNSSSHFTGLCKLQFVGDKESFFASSVGLDIGAAPLALPVGGAMSYSSGLCLFNSIHPTDYLTITVSPRYTFLGLTNFTEQYGFTRTNNILGYSSGLIVGKKHQFSVELSQYVNNTGFSFDTRPIMSFGYIWNLK